MIQHDLIKTIRANISSQPPLIKKVALAAVAIAILTVGFGFYYLSSLRSELPSISDIRQAPLNIPLRIYSSEDKLIAEYGNERRIPVSLDKIPPLLIAAVLATEDDRFYHHSGVDFAGIMRALWINFRSKSRSQGASTITMQVARNFFLTPEKTYKRKIKEMLLALSIERALTKDEILELYLNKIFLGHRAYGFAAASQVYYGVELEDLSVPEITMLAGLPKAPSRDNPISNPQRAIERRDYVLKRLRDLDKIDELSYNTARSAPITAEQQLTDGQPQATYVAEMVRKVMVERFGEQVYDLGYQVYVTINSESQKEAERALRAGLVAYDQRHGFRGAVANINLEETPPELLAETLSQLPKSRGFLPAVVLEANQRTISALTHQEETILIEWKQIEWARPYITPNEIGPKPSAATEVVQRGDVIYVSRIWPDGRKKWRLDQLPEVSGALVSIDPKSGAILSLTGGFDYYISEFNRAIRALRQPGSNIKPFIYSAALDNGFTTSSLVSAAPIVTVDDSEGVWRPQNYSKKFFGPTRLRKALSLSLNLVSVRLLRAIGIEKTIEHLAKFGFDVEDLPHNLTLALGSIDVTPLQLATGFAVFANGGKLVTPHLITRIEDVTGNVVELSPEECEFCLHNKTISFGLDGADSNDQNSIVTSESILASLGDASAQTNQAISPQNAFLVTSMMQDVITNGTGRRALALNRTDLSGKTGTTNNYQDAWFSGFNQNLVTTVFVGFDQPSHLGRKESGATAALPIWIDYMRKVLKEVPEKDLIPPPNVTTAFINQDTTDVTALDDKEGILEYYIEGTEPDSEVKPNLAAPAKRDDEKSDTLF